MGEVKGLSYDNIAGHFLRDGKILQLSDSEKATINNLKWWQAIPLAPDCTTPGYFRCAELYWKYYLDQLNLEGRSVLGIGCYEGFQLYMADALGASRVVGITDDFDYAYDLQPSRDFCKRILGSKVEWINQKFSELDPKSIGKFDVVFFFDALPHIRNAYGAIEKVQALAETIVFVSSPIVLDGTTNSACYQLTRMPLSQDSRNCSGPTLNWIKRSFEDFGYNFGKMTIYEEAYVSGYLVRGPVPPPINKVSIEDLPDDSGDESRTVILMMTCKKYEQVWEPFFTLFRRYWPDCPYRVYMGTDTGRYPGVDSIEVGEDRHWASNTLAVLEKIEADRIILFQEDFLLTGRVNTPKVRKLVKHSRSFDIASLRLYWFPSPTSKWEGTDYLGVVGPFDEFRLSFQLTIWDKAYYQSILVPGEDPWTLEVKGARRTGLTDRTFLGIWDNHDIPIPYLDYAIDKGEWRDEALELLKREGIDTSKLSKKLR